MNKRHPIRYSTHALSLDEEGVVRERHYSTEGERAVHEFTGMETAHVCAHCRTAWPCDAALVMDRLFHERARDHISSSVFGERHPKAGCESCSLPTTEIGRHILSQFHGWPDRLEFPWNLLGPEDIIAIEDEARGAVRPTFAFLQACLAVIGFEENDEGDHTSFLHRETEAFILVRTRAKDERVSSHEMVGVKMTLQERGLPNVFGPYVVSNG